MLLFLLTFPSCRNIPRILITSALAFASPWTPKKLNISSVLGELDSCNAAHTCVWRELNLDNSFLSLSFSLLKNEFCSSNGMEGAMGGRDGDSSFEGYVSLIKV